LPHLTPMGTAHMVSIADKAITKRTAIAQARVCFTNPETVGMIKAKAMKKGDVLSVARIAGIMAAKRCPDLIPLAHPINLTHVSVDLQLANSRSAPSQGTPWAGCVNIQSTVECTGKTGVEMEALTAVSATALTVIDMCKAVDKGAYIALARVVFKDGGRSGKY
ncbi:molybdenum cofactor biosynthesis protein C, partial [Polyplosphaeria fusca]